MSILELAGEKVSKRESESLNKLSELMTKEFTDKKTVNDHIAPIEILIGVTEYFFKHHKASQKNFNAACKEIMTEIGKNIDFRGIMKKYDIPMASFAVALLKIGCKIFDTENSIDKVINELLDEDKLTLDDLEELGVQNMSSISKDTARKLLSFVREHKDEDEKEEKADSKIFVADISAFAQLIKDDRLSDDTIYQAIKSDSVDMVELSTKLPKEAMYKVLDIINSKSSEEETELEEEITFSNKDADGDESFDIEEMLKTECSKEEKEIRKAIDAGKLNDEEIAEAIACFKLNPSYLEYKGFSSQRLRKIAEIVTPNLIAGLLDKIL